MKFVTYASIQVFRLHAITYFFFFQFRNVTVNLTISGREQAFCLRLTTLVHARQNHADEISLLRACNY